MNMFAMVAGVALSSLAMAQPVGVDQRIPRNEVKRVPLACFAGALRPIGFDSRTVAAVYDNQVDAPAVYTTTAATNVILDDITLAESPATGATFPLTLSTFEVLFQVKTLTAANVDMEVTFFDNVNPTAAAGTSVIAAETAIGGFVIPFRNIPAIGVYTTGEVDLATIALALPDPGCFVRIRFLQPGTTTLMASANVGAAFPGTLDEGVTWKSFNTAGTSLSGSWVNFDNDATALEVADRANFGYPACLDLGLTLKADVPVVTPICPADFNGDNVLDFFDYLDFVQAFSTGC